MFDLKCLLSSWILCEVFSQALSELSPPHDVPFEAGVRWGPSTDRPGVKYTVQYHTCGNVQDEWQDVPGCVQTVLTTCNEVSRLGCVMVRVWAQDGNKTPESVQNFTHAMSCSPKVQLTPKPGLLYINWTRNNELYEEYADHLQYLVCYGREGEQLKNCSHSLSPTKLPDLEVDVRYCVQVQYVCYNKLFGTPSRLKCASFLESETQWRQKAVLISFAIAILLGVLFVGVGLFLYNNHEKIKQFIHPLQLQIPEHITEFLSQDFPNQSRPLTGALHSIEEHHDVISIILPEDDQSDTESPAESEEEQVYNSPNGVESSSASLDHYE